MGKQKRARQKFHLASVKGRFAENDSKSESGKSAISMKSSASKWKVTPDDDIFKNMEIDIDNLKKLDSVEDDRKSMRSISKSIKRSIAESGTDIHLKKKDKRELRRNLFIKKIDAVHQLIQKNKKSKKNVNAQTNLEELPQENMLFFKSEFKPPKGPRPVSLKLKPIAKAKKRKQEMLNNIDAFRKLMSEQSTLSDPFGALTESIQQKVFNEEL